MKKRWILNVFTYFMMMAMIITHTGIYIRAEEDGYENAETSESISYNDEYIHEDTCGIEGTSYTDPSSFPLVDGKRYVIQSALSHMAIEVSNGDTTNRKQLNVWPFTYPGDLWQTWIAVQQSSGYVFKNASTGMAMDIKYASQDEGAQVTQCTIDGADSQVFKVYYAGSGLYGLINLNSNKAVDIYESSTAEGATLNQCSWTGGANQLWYFEPAEREFSLCLDPNGGAFSDGSISPKTPATKLQWGTNNWYNVSEYVATRDGYSLDGWYTAPDGGTKIYDAEGATVNDGAYWRDNIFVYEGNLTVYAQWTATIPELVTSITLSETSKELSVGDTLQLTASVEPDDAIKDLKWSSSDTSVATVEDGLIKAIAAGSSTITAAATDLSGISATCGIVVKEKESSPTAPTDPSDPADPTVPNDKLSVTQTDGVYGTPLSAPTYEKPTTEGTETLSYTGTLSKDKSAYGPTAVAPDLPGKYTVTVTYDTGSTKYTGSADFAIAKANWDDNKVRTKGAAGVDGRFDLSKKIAEGAKLGSVTITKGGELFEKDPHLSGTLLEWRIKDTVTAIDISLSIPATDADNYNDYNISVSILGDSSLNIDGRILLNGKDVSSFNDALNQMKDPGTDYVLLLGVDIQEKGFTLPKTAKSITINGYGHTLEFIGTKLTASVPLSLENIVIKPVKKNGLKTKLSLTAKKDLRICSGTTFATTSTSITCNSQLTLSTALDAKALNANDLILDHDAALKAAGKNTITVKGTFKGNGGAIELGQDFRKPVILKDTVEGTINITGEKQADGIQILKCSSKKISADTLKKSFNVSAVTSNDIDTYLYYFSNGKAGIFGESVSYNGIRYGIWKDAVSAMNADYKSGKATAFSVELIGNVNMKGAFKLPAKGYESITISGNNSIVTFTGNIKLTGNTTIKNTTLNKTDKKGNKVSGSVNKGKFSYDGPESF